MYRDPSEERIVENFLDEEGIDEEKKIKILQIIKGMGELFYFILCSYVLLLCLSAHRFPFVFLSSMA